MYVVKGLGALKGFHPASVDTHLLIELGPFSQNHTPTPLTSEGT